MFYDEHKLNKWLLENVDGRFGVIGSIDRVTIFFEDDNDAILFMLREGEKNWHKD